MRRPYGEGSRFAVPLGDRRCALGFVARGTRKVLDLAFLTPEPWCVRASDRALRDERWPVVGYESGFTRVDWPAPESDEVLGPGILERTLAARLAGRAFDRPHFAAYDVTGGSPNDSRWNGATRVQWRSPLDRGVLAAIEAVQRQRGLEVRLYGAAASQADALASWPALERLSLEAAAIPDELPPFATVTSLALDGVPRRLRLTLASFPRLRVLRVRARGARLSAADLLETRSLRGLDVHGAELVGAQSLGALPSLDALDVREAAVDDVDAILRLPLAGLRLGRLRDVRTIAAVGGNATLRALALDALTGVDDVAAIGSVALESLELRGFWQLAVEDVAFVAAMPTLRRLRLDIGGRRKNVEIYRRGLFADPLPFEVTSS